MTVGLRGTAPHPVPGPPRTLLPDDAWHGYLAVYDHLASVTIAVLPMVALAAWVLARRRRSAGVEPGWATRTAVTEVGLVYAMLPALWLTLDPGARAGSVTGAVSLVPLQDLPHMGTFQVVGNLLLLAVPGFLAPLRFAVVASLPRMLVAAAAVSASIETAQYVLQLDRVSSVDDVLLNTIGAGLAALASRRGWRGRRDRDLTRPRRAAVV
ncbi:VanZ family protein [Intrasporangium flavum]|uniref:VanZ family protein n=1 Tax=Intrasporangium flavum TaxID=1428657 RepID=UPI001A966CF0|nr:VanZ family protein [Intrasporangium flavum]